MSSASCTAEEEGKDLDDFPEKSDRWRYHQQPRLGPYRQHSNVANYTSATATRQYRTGRLRRWLELLAASTIDYPVVSGELRHWSLPDCPMVQSALILGHFHCTAEKVVIFRTGLSCANCNLDMPRLRHWFPRSELDRPPYVLQRSGGEED